MATFVRFRRAAGWSLALVWMSASVWAAQQNARITSLKTVAVPKPPDLGRYVRDERMLVVLGKALFWDVQISSDNRVACATCHFHAGADHRRQHQLSTTKDPVTPNWTLGPGDFPFSTAFMAAGHRAGSAGMVARRFAGVSTGGGADAAADVDDRALPGAPGLALRHVTPRNAPTVINAVFMFRNFWDGRASDVFNGATPFGESDPRPHVLVDTPSGLALQAMRIEQASLASQAVGPPLDDGEMSYQGRTWAWLGRKVLDAAPLALQQVAPDDSVLGPFANADGRGLRPGYTYSSLVHAAFQPQYFRSLSLVNEHGADLGRRTRRQGEAAFRQDEYNFGFFFGLAIQAYEATLVSDDSPYDRYLDGQRDALTNQQLIGMEMFQRRACASCHVDPELSLATYSGVFGAFGFKGMGPDAGFFFTGVEPVDNDPGLGAKDPFGAWLSRTAQANPAQAPSWRGLFKTPSLRNVELTGPYFHSGSKSSLEQIVDFYTIGGDYGSGALRRWAPDASERVAMPAFMASFTDDRVKFERAPFDHPELCVAIGHAVSEPDGATPQAAPPRLADERWARVPAIGAGGNRVPLQTFEELLRGIGIDGTRAHALTEPCRSW
ncbi:MAG: cytochrome-c peroxidase [Acidobacteria bacterium]|nr:cytochrome-c peroxidase [Acidobacteriota bacterium]